jgi:hypothetical protein
MSNVKHVKHIECQTSNIKHVNNVKCHNANNVKLVKQQHFKVQSLVKSVTRVNSAFVVVIVRYVHWGLTRTAKVKPRAILLLLAHPEKYPTTNVPGVNCHRGVPAKEMIT